MIYFVQERPNHPGDGGEGDAVVFTGSEIQTNESQRFKSWNEAVLYATGNCESWDSVVILPPDMSDPG